MNLSLEQQQAVDCTSPLIVVRAAPGAGKTKTVIARVVRLVQSGVSPAKIVLITFTTKAAQEMEHRLEPHGFKVQFVGTLHRWCLGLIRENHKLLNLPAQLSVVDDALKEEVLAEVVAEQKYKGTRLALDVVLYAGPYVKWPMPNKYQVTAKAYFQKMFEGGMLDFDMLLACGVEALKRGAQYDVEHLLIDEAQDMCGLDFTVYRALNCSKFVVGDEKQAIMGFRGGNVEWMQHFAGAAKAQGSLLELTGCYRCGSRILDAANALISHDGVHSPSMSLTGTRGSVTVAQFKNDTDEIRHIAALINRNCTSAEQYNEVAVLVRYNALVTRFANGLRAHGIPVAERQEVQRPKDWALATALVSFVGNPENDRLALTYIEARYGKEVAWRAKEAACREMVSVWGHWVPQFPLIAVELSHCSVKLLDWLFNECSVSTESQSLILPLLDRCTSPNELLLQMNEQDSSATHGEGVTVTTIHSYKGREAETIILPAFEEGIMPGRNEDEVPELRRLAYVGMTRAKSQLVITHCAERARMYGFGNENMERSRFLDEAGLI